MKKSFLFGLLVLLIIAIVATVMQDLALFQSGAFIVGVLSIIAAGILSNVLGSGDRIRANMATERDEDRRQRQDWSLKIFLFGLPSFVGAVLSYFYF